MQGAAPVDQPVLSVNQPLLKQPHKSLLHSCNQVVVHGESQAVPVHTDAHAPHLAEDLATVRLHPGEDLLQEGLPPCKCPKAVSGTQGRFRHTNRIKLCTSAAQYHVFVSHSIAAFLKTQ